MGTGEDYTYSNPYVSSDVQSAYNYAEPIPVYVEAPVYTESQAPATNVVVNNSPSDVNVDNQAPAATPSPTLAPETAEPAAAPPSDQSQAADQSQATDDPKVKEAVGLFDEGRALFAKGDYAGAQAKVDKAIGIMPQDRVLHEFRALVLFAQQKYSEAAATLYAVLSVGPGWNWDTLKSFYPNVDTFTQQLRTLEAHAKSNSKAADERFVLAYLYLAMGQMEPAIKMLEQVTSLAPKDQLSAQILKAIKPKQPEAPTDRPQAGSG
jgi:tetratricopeptide (TPR) repeat protein